MKIMNVIKRHKSLAIVLGLSLILLIIIFIIFARMFFFSSNSSYGDRLRGIVSVPLEVNNELISKLEEMDEVSSVSIRTQGKIIYITITYTGSVSKDRAKEIASDTYKTYSEEIIEDYDFEYFLTQDIEESEEVSPFVIAGTKHPDIDYISWTKN